MFSRIAEKQTSYYAPQEGVNCFTSCEYQYAH